MGIQHIQSNLTGGELAPELHARVDIDKYNTSVAHAENVVIIPQGGFRRRPGLSKIEDGVVGEDARLIPFVFNKTQQYLLVFRANNIDILKNGVKLATVDSSAIYTTMDIINDLDIIQSADTVIITNGDIAPYKLMRGASESIWTLSTIDLIIPFHNWDNIEYVYENTGTKNPIISGATDNMVTTWWKTNQYIDETPVINTTTVPDFTMNINIDDVIWNNDDNNVNGLSNRFYKSKLDRIDIVPATEDFTNTINWEDLGSGKEDIWSATRGYPISCTFYMGRLWFGGSTSKPTSIWGSRVNGFYDFTAESINGSIPDDHAIFDTIEASQYNKITNIFGGRGLQIFTTGAEYFNTVEIITPSNSAWKSQTGYGSKGIRPIFIDGATLFVDSSSRTIREFIYSLDEDSYVSNSITLLASHLLTDIKSFSSIKGTDIDVSDFVYVVNEDGSLAVMNTLRNEGILGWTHWTTDGEFLDVCVVDKAVYFLVKREGEYFIELLNEDSYTDHNVVHKGTAPTTFNVIDGSYNNVVYNGNNVIYTDISTGTPITEIDTDFDPVFDTIYFKVIADLSIMPDAFPEITSPGDNKFTITRNAYRLEVGLDYTTKIITLPLNTMLRNGATLHRRKRIVKADISIYESLGIYMKNIHSPDRKFTVALDQAPEPITGFKELYLLGYDRIVQLEIIQENPLPMLIRSIGYEVAY